MGRTREVLIPGGVWADGWRHRTAALRPLCGADELFARGLAAEPPRVVTALLARCLRRLGPHTRPTAEAVSALAVGDREALTWHLRRLTVGDRLQGVVGCPAGGCGEKLDLDLRVSDLLVPAYPEHPPERVARFEIDGVGWEVRYRLPTGADQEAVAGLAARDPAAAAAELMRGCVAEARADGRPAALTAAVAERVSAAMAGADPQAEARLDLTCPVCGGRFEGLLDAAGFLAAEVRGRAGRLFREVHALARAYHWSESDILRLPPDRRATYLALVADDAERRGS